ncbi:MAG: SpoIID/LytB domain-containing protein [Brasilonema angustatum HA4187-MV1]|jgi:SpoIID/LytB domain protein|nr:SpoIID/LytB domain-containing protein [Brasilonema angustatum HA4187-MV1]
MKIIWRISYTVLTTFCLLGLTGASGPASSTKDVEIRIGIVQRFGDNSTEQLELEPTKGDRLRLKFQDGKRQETVVTTNPVKLEVLMQALPVAVVKERVVLGTYRTYETAEDSAKHWRDKGIEVEIAQPERWQVWAKRDVYNTPLLRRLLLSTVESAVQKTAFVDSQVLQSVPRVTWQLNGKRYNLDNLEISSDKNLIRVNETKKPEKAHLYAGRMKLQPNAYGTYTLINEVPLETYLRGVVPYEIGASAPTAAMEAQAVLARTYALRNLHRFAIDGYQLSADTHCQVYYGLSGVTPNTDRAIATTRGMVLTYRNNLVDALYSSTTGGVTASFSDVWNGDDRPYLQPIIDAPSDNVWNLSGQNLADENQFQRFISLKIGFNESQKDLFRWRKESSLKDITKDLQKFLKVKNSPYAKFKSIRDMKVVERSKSGRILKLDVKTDIGTFSLHKDEVRSAFAAPVSTLFYLQPLNKGESELWGYAFVGGGLGHGVGLSQVGAQNLAQLGWENQKILQFYYPGTKIQILGNGISGTN